VRTPSVVVGCWSLARRQDPSHKTHQGSTELKAES
jgi:hypothetical protein